MVSGGRLVISSTSGLSGRIDSSSNHVGGRSANLISDISILPPTRRGGVVAPLFTRKGIETDRMIFVAQSLRRLPERAKLLAQTARTRRIGLDEPGQTVTFDRRQPFYFELL